MPGTDFHWFARSKKLLEEWLNRPFPCPKQWYERTIVSFFIALLIFLVLFVFRPFGIEQAGDHSGWLIGGYSTIAFLLLIFSSHLFPVVFTKFFDPDEWTIGKYALHIFIDYFLITMFSWLFTETAGQKWIEADNFFKFMLLTLAVGLFPVLSIIWIYERISIRRKMRSASFLSHQLDKLQQHSIPKTGLILKTGSKTPDLQIDSGDFICARSIGNYCVVHYRQTGEVRHMMIRTTIRALEKQAEPDPSIVCCHRGTLVNLNHVERFGGNARNYFLTLRGTDFKLDIARLVPDSILEFLKKI